MVKRTEKRDDVATALKEQKRKVDDLLEEAAKDLENIFKNANTVNVTSKVTFR